MCEWVLGVVVVGGGGGLNKGYKEEGKLSILFLSFMITGVFFFFWLVGTYSCNIDSQFQ